MDNDDGGNDDNDGCGCHVEKKERCGNISRFTFPVPARQLKTQ